MNGNTTHPINYAKALEHIGDDESLLDLLLTELIDGTEANLKKLDEALSTEAYKTIYVTAHSIKGSAACVHAYHLREMALNLESASCVGKFTPGQESLEQFKAMTAKIKSAFEEVRKAIEGRRGGCDYSSIQSTVVMPVVGDDRSLPGVMEDLASESFGSERSNRLVRQASSSSFLEKSRVGDDYREAQFPPMEPNDSTFLVFQYVGMLTEVVQSFEGVGSMFELGRTLHDAVVRVMGSVEYLALWTSSDDDGLRLRYCVGVEGDGLRDQSQGSSDFVKLRELPKVALSKNTRQSTEVGEEFTDLIMEPAWSSEPVSQRVCLPITNANGSPMGVLDIASSSKALTDFTIITPLFFLCSQVGVIASTLSKINPIPGVIDTSMSVGSNRGGQSLNSGSRGEADTNNQAEATQEEEDIGMDMQVLEMGIRKAQDSLAKTTSRFKGIMKFVDDCMKSEVSYCMSHTKVAIRTLADLFSLMNPQEALGERPRSGHTVPFIKNLTSQLMPVLDADKIILRAPTETTDYTASLQWDTFASVVRLLILSASQFMSSGGSVDLASSKDEGNWILGISLMGPAFRIQDYEAFLFSSNGLRRLLNELHVDASTHIVMNSGLPCLEVILAVSIASEEQESIYSASRLDTMSEYSGEGAQKKKILVVDDEPLYRSMVSKCLPADRFECTLCESGERGLAVVNDEAFDLAIVDITMPGINGIETVEKMRRLENGKKCIVILFSARKGLDDIAKGFAVGANDYIVKPFTKADLVMRVERHLSVGAESSAYQYQTQLGELNLSYMRFCPQETVYLLKKNSIMDVELGDKREMDLAILFCDIRGYTSLSEGRTPQENFEFLVSLFSRVSVCVTKNHGHIDKFLGDGMLALFRNPIDAIRTGIDMTQELRTYNESRVSSGEVPVRMGIGLHLGSVVYGVMGNKERMECTVISDAVNLASRIEGVSKVYGATLLMSNEIYGPLKGMVGGDLPLSARRLGRVRVAGKSEPVELYDVISVLDEEEALSRGKSRERFEECVRMIEEGRLEEARSGFGELKTGFKDDIAIDHFIDLLDNHSDFIGEDGSYAIGHK